MQSDFTDIKEFPFRSRLNFRKLVEFWEENLNKGGAAFFAPGLLDTIKNSSDLVNPVDDTKILQKHQHLVDLLISAVIPPGLTETDMAAAIVPFKNEPLFTSKAFDNALSFKNLDDKVSVNIPGERLVMGKTIQACLLILQKFYGVPVDFNISKAALLNITDEKTGLQKVYKIVTDFRFCEIIPRKELSEIDPGIIKFMTEKIYELDLLLQYIRPEDFEFQGLMILRLTEVTREEMISSMKYDLLRKDAVVNPSSFNTIQQKLKSVFSMPDLMLGLAYFDPNNNLVLNTSYGWKSLTDNPSYACVYAGSIYERSWTEQRTITIENLETYPFRTKIEDALLANNIKSVLLAPLVDENETIGLLELATHESDKLTPISVARVESVLPIFTAAVKRVKSDMEMEVRALIQEECTAIHPAVQWRFFEAGVNLMNKRRTEPHAAMEEIKFQQVYPFFGMADIRNSSLERNVAIQDDLSENLKMALTLLNEINHHIKLPVVEELIFKTQSNLAVLNHNLATGDEVNVLDFLRKEVNPIVEHFTSDSSLSGKIIQYKNNLDPSLGIVYKKRKEFEESLSQINKLIADIIEEADESAQRMFPHYFEKYKTDGVEFTLYLGEALIKNRKFDQFYLRNFRLWQLLLMCSIERAMDQLKPKLKKQLEITQLLLVHDQPVTIRFRQDEKRFDVDGAYDIRYEIVKKRIDKAYIKDTNERLTQPGTIAIVFSQPKIVQEYKQYFNYLSGKGLIKKTIEEFDLEELPGANGLKAMRITLDGRGSFKKETEALLRDIEKSINA